MGKQVGSKAAEYNNKLMSQMQQVPQMQQAPNSQNVSNRSMSDLQSQDFKNASNMLMSQMQQAQQVQGYGQGVNPATTGSQMGNPYAAQAQKMANYDAQRQYQSAANDWRQQMMQMRPQWGQQGPRPQSPWGSAQRNPIASALRGNQGVYQGGPRAGQPISTGPAPKPKPKRDWRSGMAAGLWQDQGGG